MLRVVIIKGNLKWDVEACNKMYNTIQSFILSKFPTTDIVIDPGLPLTIPDKTAHIWIGHSRGTDRFKWADKKTQLLGLGTEKSSTYKVVNHPHDNTIGKNIESTIPNSDHYMFTDKMQESIVDMIVGIKY